MTDERPIDQTRALALRYLGGTLSDAEASAFEARLETDATLQAAFEQAAAEPTPEIDAARAWFDREADAMARAATVTIEAPPMRSLVPLAADPRDRAGAARGGRSPRRESGRWRRLAIPAALAAGLGGGVVIGAASLGEGLFGDGLFGAPPANPAAGAPGWRMSVAIYHRLYSDRTFASLPVPPAEARAALTRVGAAIEADLAPAAETNAPLRFERAQLLRFGERPLAQLSYSTPEGRPFALCVIARAEPASAEEPIAYTSERLLDQNTVTWRTGTHVYLLIGDAPDQDLRSLAEDFAARLG